MLEELGGWLWRFLKRCWAKKDLRLHVATWGVSSFMAAGLYFYIGFRADEAASAIIQEKKIQAVELHALREGVERVEKNVGRIYDYLLYGPDRLPAGSHAPRR